MGTENRGDPTGGRKKRAACERDGAGRGESGADTRSLACMVREGAVDKTELPYEKFEQLGAGALTDAELLAIIIRTGSGRNTPMAIGRQILAADGTGERGLSNLCHLTLAELQTIPGIGRVKAVKLKCIAELSRRMAEERTKPALDFGRPERVAAHYMERMRHEETERVLLVCLNRRMMFLTDHLLTVGTVDHSLLSPREIYRTALRDSAVNILLLHNHPGGDPAPSRADIHTTTAIADVGKELGVTLADHLIIGDGQYYSFRENGLLD